MKKMIALRRHAYGVGQKEKGERYEASPDEARTLVALGWAKFDTEGADETPAGDGDETPEPPKTPAEKPASKKPAGKGKYSRRDMTAKD